MLTRADLERLRTTSPATPVEVVAEEVHESPATYSTDDVLSCWDGEKFVSWAEWERRLPNVPHYEDPRSVEMRERYERERAEEETAPRALEARARRVAVKKKVRRV
jgi:hypothetical protein